jgi:hypothetical protein
MSTFVRDYGNPAKHNAKLTPAERLHQWLHQISESDERSAASVLFVAVAETLGDEAAGRVLAALEKQVKPAPGVESPPAQRYF